VRIVARKCEQGAALSQALAESMHFDRTVAGLAAWGEANDALPAALRLAVDHYEQEIEQYVTFLRRIATPVMYVGVLATVMFFIFAMFVPLADMSWAW
jgi:type IV pilus assembly protein PilC